MAGSTSGFAVVRWHADSCGYKFPDGREAAAPSVVADACASTPTPPPRSDLPFTDREVAVRFLPSLFSDSMLLPFVSPILGFRLLLVLLDQEPKAIRRCMAIFISVFFSFSLAFSLELEASPMAGGFRQSEAANRGPRNSSFGESSGNSEPCSFELARDPVVTRCGHLFCWPCLYRWLHGHSHSSECPACKAIVEEKMLTPLYGRGDNSVDPRSKSVPDMNIPQRPAGQRPATAPQPDPNQFQHTNPWFVGGAPMASTRFGNLTFSAAIAGLFPLLSFHVHGFPDSIAHGPAAGTPYDNGFHGGHVHGFPRQAHHGQQADVYLKALLFLVGAFVIISLVWF
ncbi:zinc finger, C3HC4 type, domain containing protein [Musa troglodytarum]|uniref:E3 ubiquitin-protein ligase RMA n=1 Tax=Musa troglodytarum TaxID=320322 RepID=A0A9E7LAH9_9LILI|nr:zinc finger, C3HC4 type, domain containing protein [Musa troglodytarum]